MTSKNNPSAPPHKEGSKPSLFYSPDSASKLVQSSTNESHLTQGQVAVSTSIQTGETPAPSSLTTSAGINLNLMRPEGSQNPVRGRESPSSETPKRSPPRGRFIQKTEESNFVDPSHKLRASTPSSGKGNRAGASRTQRVPVDYNIKGQFVPKKRASDRRDVDPQSLPPGWVDFDKVIRGADEAMARAAKNSTRTTAMPAITETFKQVTGSEDRTRIGTHKTDIPMLPTDAPAKPTHATGGMDLDEPSVSNALGDGVPELSSVAAMLSYWQNTFRDRRVCLTSDPKGPHLSYEQLLCFSTSKVNDPSYGAAGYLKCDVLDNATAALLGGGVQVVPTAEVSRWMQQPPPNFPAMPEINKDCNYIIMYVNSGSSPGLHWHVVVIDVNKKLCQIRDSAYDEYRVQETGFYMESLASWKWGRGFITITEHGPQQDDAYNCGVFAHDNAVQLVRGGTDSRDSGETRRIKLLKAIIDKALTHRQVLWQPNPSKRIFPATDAAGMPATPDVDLSKETNENALPFRPRPDLVRQDSDTSVAASHRDWANDYDLLSSDASPGAVQPDGVENPISTEMDVEDDGATNRLALALATPSSNACLEEPLLWRSLPQTARTEWAKKQVLERIPDYMQLHNVQTSAGSTFLTAADVVRYYHSIEQSQNPLPRIMLLQDETLIATRTMKTTVPGVYTVLNMASEKRPGGQLFMDSLQQEESLCMQSDLYHRLEKMSDHYPLRPGELIISNDVFVCFSNRHRALPRQECYNTNVISMAAPICNKDMIGVRYIGSAQATQMQANIKTLLDAADASGTNVLVLGAWGCGVYRNPVASVAQMFHAELSSRDWSRSSLTHVIFAICDEAEGQPVWKAFQRRFDGCLPGFEPTVVDHMANFCNNIGFGRAGPQE